MLSNPEPDTANCASLRFVSLSAKSVTSPFSALNKAFEASSSAALALIKIEESFEVTVAPVRLALGASIVTCPEDSSVASKAWTAYFDEVKVRDPVSEFKLASLRLMA